MFVGTIAGAIDSFEAIRMKLKGDNYAFQAYAMKNFQVRILGNTSVGSEKIPTGRKAEILKS